jgi:hypothetical protein
MLSVMDIIYYLCLLLVSTRNPRVHPLTLIHLYIYIQCRYWIDRHGHNCFVHARKIRSVKNLTCNCAHMYKLTETCIL